MSTKVTSSNKYSFLSLLKGAIVSVSMTLILILLFALFIRFFNINDNWIFPINQVIKIISLFAGIMAAIKYNNEKGFVKGIILGIIYFILSFIVFSILQGAFTVNVGNLYDFILTIFASGLIGIILVNIKSK